MQASSFQSCKINFNRYRSAGGGAVAKKSPATTEKRSCRPSSSAALIAVGTTWGRSNTTPCRAGFSFMSEWIRCRWPPNIDRDADGLRIDQLGSFSVKTNEVLFMVSVKAAA